VKYDDRDSHRPGWKFAEYELKGIPVRITVGERDLANGTIEVARRDDLTKTTIQLTELDNYIENLLTEIQSSLLQKAQARMKDLTTRVDTYDEFKKVLDSKAGFVYAHWDGTPETEEKIKEETKATIRCIPINNPLEDGVCIYSGKPSQQRVLFARAY
jgi:prolyl-tRNA synthetase